jgi:choline dehydrogenase-like flavoprotein
VGNEHDLVGRYFMEHLSLSCGGAVFAGAVDAFTLYGMRETAAAEADAPPIKVLGYLAPDAAAQERERLLAMEITLGVLPLPALDRIAPPTERLDGLATKDVARLAAPAGAAVASAVRVVGEQAPNPQSRVTLTDERDVLGVPEVALDWRPQASDRASIVRGLLLLARGLGRSGLGRLQIATGELLGKKLLPGASFVATSEALSDPPAGLDFAVGTGFHHMGTARMHADARHGVVDALCRVLSLPNLYVAGSAVFPTGGSAGPTFTLVALAIRLADHLRRVLA